MTGELIREDICQTCRKRKLVDADGLCINCQPEQSDSHFHWVAGEGWQIKPEFQGVQIPDGLSDDPPDNCHAAEARREYQGDREYERRQR